MSIAYEDLLYVFEVGEHVDETAFYFDDAPKEDEHYIGYMPRFDGKINDKPYWIGLCDINVGCEFETAKELFEAKVFNGKSIKERWEHIVIFQIGGILPVADYMEMYGKEILKNKNNPDRNIMEQ